MSGAGNTMVINLGRRRMDFSERDRLLLNLVRPHYERAFQKIQELAGRFSGGDRPLSTYGLTPREAEVANWLVEGKSNPEIGLILGASPRTVEKHMEKILEKLCVENRATAAMTVVQGRKLDCFAGGSRSQYFPARILAWFACT